MIDAWGGWNLFQELLSILQLIAQRYSVSIPNVVVRYVLERPAVAGAIIGARLGVSQHIEDNVKVFSFKLDAEDHNRIDTVLKRSRDLYQLIGDCGDEYR